MNLDHAGSIPAPLAMKHEWWNPGEKYPNLEWLDQNGNPYLSCKKCLAMKNDRILDAECKGQAKIELR